MSRSVGIRDHSFYTYAKTSGKLMIICLVALCLVASQSVVALKLSVNCVWAQRLYYRLYKKILEEISIVCDLK